MRKNMYRLAGILLAAGVLASSAGCSGGKVGDGDSVKSAGTAQAGGDSRETETENPVSRTAGEQSEEAGSGEGGQAGNGPEADQLEQIRQKGQLVVAMEGTWSPWTYHDEDDRLVGYDVEVAQLIADKLGVEAVFVEGEWDGLFAGLDAGRYDMVVNGVEVTEERREKYDFSDPYAYIRTAVVVKGDEDRIQSFEDLDGMRTANTISSTYAELAESYGAVVTGVDDLNQTFELLLSGRIDATLNAELTYYDYMKAHPDRNLKIAALTEEASLVVIPMRKGEASASLREAVNQALIQLRDSGDLARLSEKYFGSDISGDPREHE